jgi:arylsulfatase A
VELYDLSQDLSEKQDLAQSIPDKAAELLADLRTWRKSVDAQMPSLNPDYDLAKVKPAKKATSKDQPKQPEAKATQAL